MDNTAVATPFRIEISDEQIDDLHRRLDAALWPDQLPETGFAHGIPVGAVRALAERWRNAYDWRTYEAELNSYPHHPDSAGLRLLRAHIGDRAGLDRTLQRADRHLDGHPGIPALRRARW